MTVGDFDGDGRLDLACGNWGRNSIYALNGAPTMRIFHGDWSGAGGVQMVEAWRSGTNWIPFRDRGWLSRGLPSLAAQFPTHEAFGQATVRDLVGAAYEKTSFVEATTLASMVFLNRGGRFEAIPLPDAAVDVIISNCVINLSADKRQVLREAYRVLRPGGRFAVSDVVAQGALPADLRADMEAWVGCVAGALEEREYRDLLTEAGFRDVTVEVTRVYDPRDLAESTGSGAACCGTPEEWDHSAYGRFAASGGRLVSAFIRATRGE